MAQVVYYLLQKKQMNNPLLLQPFAHTTPTSASPHPSPLHCLAPPTPFHTCSLKVDMRLRKATLELLAVSWSTLDWMLRLSSSLDAISA